ncbi:MAG: hypothetical protein CMJ19_24465 [Phycisphaeraceae bacterium]|nr:hypothetical protein [Phycisphaeraceae bacterium]
MHKNSADTQSTKQWKVKHQQVQTTENPINAKRSLEQEPDVQAPTTDSMIVSLPIIWVQLTSPCLISVR